MIKTAIWGIVMDEPHNDALKLGGNIELSGFSGLNGGEMVVIKKIVGNYAKRMTEICEKFENLSLNMKPVHKTEGSKKFELHAKLLDNGNQITSEVTERNLFVGVDDVLKNVVNAIKK